MISDALTFLVTQLNEYLHAKMGLERLVFQRRLVNVAGSDVVTTESKISCQLINVEEERVGKAQQPIGPAVNGGFPMRNPELRVNLSLMFASVCQDTDPDDLVEEENYSLSIRLISLVLQFFQHKHYFSTENSPSLPASIGSLVVELYPISLESQNYLWASLGAKYRPSVVYKVRMITILEDATMGVVGTPRYLETNGNLTGN